MPREDGLEIPLLRAEGVALPFYASEGAAGADVCAYLDAPLTLFPGKRALIPTSLRFAIPPGFEIQVRPRSGLALKYGVTVLNTPGTIDSDYRGELGILLINHGEAPFVVEPGMRIAQIVVAPIAQVVFVQEESLMTTARGEGGFGHTGA